MSIDSSEFLSLFLVFAADFGMNEIYVRISSAVLRHAIRISHRVRVSRCASAVEIDGRPGRGNGERGEGTRRIVFQRRCCALIKLGAGRACNLLNETQYISVRRAFFGLSASFSLTFLRARARTLAHIRGPHSIRTSVYAPRPRLRAARREIQRTENKIIKICRDRCRLNAAARMRKGENEARGETGGKAKYKMIKKSERGDSINFRKSQFPLFIMTKVRIYCNCLAFDSFSPLLAMQIDLRRESSAEFGRFE